MHHPHSYFIFIFLNEDLDLKNLIDFKNFVHSFDSLRISIRSVEASNYYENYHISNSSSKIKDIYNKSKSCFLICSNIKIESAILNAKLRVKYLDQNFEIISSGLKHNTNIPSIFINCRLENISKNSP